MKKDDEGIRAVRDVREKISAEFENDPEKLVAHYMVEQERYRDRLLQPVPAQQGDTRRASRRERKNYEEGIEKEEQSGHAEGV